jgi:hypothetical protein
MANRCVRCEALGRKQQSRRVQLTKDNIPLCEVCLIEVAEEEDFFKREEDATGSEDPYQ